LKQALKQAEINGIPNQTRDAYGVVEGETGKGMMTTVGEKEKGNFNLPKELKKNVSAEKKRK